MKRIAMALLGLSTSALADMNRFGTMVSDDDGGGGSNSLFPLVGTVLLFAGVYVLYRFMKTRNKYSDEANYNFAFLIGLALMGVVLALM